LTDKKDLILTSPFSRRKSNEPRSAYRQTLCMRLRLLSDYDLERGVKFCGVTKYRSTLILLRDHWPIFSLSSRVSESVLTRAQASKRDVQSTQRHVDGFLMIAWHLTTMLEAQVKALEGTIRSLAYSNTDDDQARFTKLIGFRRDVAECYEDLNRSNSFVAIYLERSTHKSPFIRGGFLIDSGLDALWREDLKKPMRDHLIELQRRLEDVKEDLNEEITVAVGIVQVREAQLMRKQTQATARQTTWTVALAVLAAVYLPMTLVTGIFGMNVTEISSEPTAPNAWWAVGAWAVIAVLTVAGVLSYVMIRKLRSRQRDPDLEANSKSERSNSQAEADAGKASGKDSTDWSRWLKQKAKAIRDRKLE
jgi:Mg2+ and Co2+ transporter CorA